ncbi:MAG: hypothetical protein HOC71_04735 [Candidatus Latescibacteria bacterium]|nr:hypothetical protein [Candidatus Latescibacterota bacterium]
MLAQRNEPKKGHSGEIRIRTHCERFLGFQNSLRSHRLKSLSEILRIAREFLREKFFALFYNGASSVLFIIPVEKPLIREDFSDEELQPV